MNPWTLGPDDAGPYCPGLDCTLLDVEKYNRTLRNHFFAFGAEAANVSFTCHKLFFEDPRTLGTKRPLVVVYVVENSTLVTNWISTAAAKRWAVQATHAAPLDC